MKRPHQTPQPTRRIFVLEGILRQAARLIARSRSPEVTRQEVLVRLKELIADEKGTAFRLRSEAPDWPGNFAA